MGGAPAFLAGNGSSMYGDHGSEPVTEESDSRGDACSPASPASGRRRPSRPSRRAPGCACCAPRRSLDPQQPALPVAAACCSGSCLGARLGDGAAVHADDLAARLGRRRRPPGGSRHASGPFNLCCPVTPTNAEFTAGAGRAPRPQGVPRRPGAGPAPRGRPMAPEALGSVNLRPAALQDAGYEFRTATSRDVLAAMLTADRRDPPLPRRPGARDPPGARRVVGQRHPVRRRRRRAGDPVGHRQHQPASVPRDHLRRAAPGSPDGDPQPAVEPARQPRRVALARPSTAGVERPERAHVTCGPGRRPASIPLAQHRDRAVRDRSGAPATGSDGGVSRRSDSATTRRRARCTRRAGTPGAAAAAGSPSIPTHPAAPLPEFSTGPWHPWPGAESTRPARRRRAGRGVGAARVSASTRASCPAGRGSRSARAQRRGRRGAGRRAGPGRRRARFGLEHGCGGVETGWCADPSAGHPPDTAAARRRPARPGLGPRRR